MTLKQFYRRYDNEVNEAISNALSEDAVHNDVTTNLLLKGKEGDRKLNTVLLCKEDCILAGVEIFRRVYRQIDRKTIFKSHYKDGDRVRNKSKVLEIKSTLRNLLIGERTALNFIQRMSGIATLTNTFVRKLKYGDSKILHTRKTTPNFRLFETAAVKIGGGDFHRLSLSSSILIKDNHIKSFATLNNIMIWLKNKKLASGFKHKFEIEVKTFNELNAVVKYGKGIVKVVMLDNFKPSQIKRAIELLKKSRIKIEISGGINLQNFDKYQRNGIDYYSIGMLTHSYKSADFSLEF